jgi:hypothetical protein
VVRSNHIHYIHTTLITTFILIVPSYRRACDLNKDSVTESMIAGEMDGDAENWCAPNIVESDNVSQEGKIASGGEGMTVYHVICMQMRLLCIMYIIGGSHDVRAAENTSESTGKAAVVEDDYPDMMAYEDDSLALDSDVTVSNNAPGSKVRSARRYDVSIVYDKYYRTPRVFLFGYDENNSPLSPEAIFDDIMTDYANRTVTIEPHPHLSLPHASIHPCQHGAAMKRVLEALEECNSVPTVDQYLFIFLKFLQSVIPTIEYDYTIDVQFRKMGV